MQSGYYNATGGMVTQFNRLDLITNNLANLNTNAFKRDDVVVGDFMRLLKEGRDELPLQNHTKDSAKFLNRSLNRVPIITEEYTDMRLGALAKTDNPLDFALKDKNAFFAIQTPDGVRYTRDGSFSLNSQGDIVNKRGFLVLSRDWIDHSGGINVPNGASIEVGQNGGVRIRNLGNEELAQSANVGHIAVVSFENPKYLKKIGDNLYEYVGNDLDKNRELYTNQNILAQGFLEKSNVNAVLEMTSLIETNRLVDMYSKVMKAHMDDLNTEAIQKLASIRA